VWVYWSGSTSLVRQSVNQGQAEKLGDTVEETPNAREKSSLKDTGLVQIGYLFSVSPEKFDLDKFESAIGRSTKDDPSGLGFASLDGKSGDYGISLAWFDIKEEEMQFHARYRTGGREPGEDERPPFAEDFMKWFGSFFKYENAEAHSHAEFKFPSDMRQCRFPIPMKTSIAGDAEIEGVTFRLPSQPNGIKRAEIWASKKFWRLELIADRRITFDDFDVMSDIQAYTEVIDKLLEDKVQ
jgi:hypothetical protein